MKLDTTGLTGKDRILVLAEIIKAAEQERTLQAYDMVWFDVVSRGASYCDNLDWRIKPIIKTYYVNLYPSGTRKPFQSYTQSPSEQDARDRARQEGGAIAVAVPVTIEE